MPIRWNRRVGRRGKVSARLADWTASLAGTSYLASNNSGRIQVQLYDWTGAIQGAVTAAATFRGVIAAQLENWSASITGTRNRPPVWTPATPVTINVTSTSPVGTVVVDLAAVGPLYATDPDGDALTFTAQNLPSWLTLVGSEVRVAQPLTIGASANVTATADDNPFTSAGIASATSIVTQSTLAKPAVNVPTTLDSYNTTITRISDAVASGTTGLGPNYAQQQAWNADETLILLYNDAGFPYILDADSPYTVRVNSFSPPYGDGNWEVGAGTWKWSPLEPRSLYCCAKGLLASPAGTGINQLNWNGFASHNGAVLVKGTFDTNFAFTWKVVGSWPSFYRLTKNPSSEEARRANSKVWVGLCGEVANGVGPFTAFIHNATDSESSQANVSSAHISLDGAQATNPGFYTNPPYRQPDHVAPSPLCDYVMIAWGDGDDIRWQGKEIWSLAGVFVKQLEGTNDHADYVLDSTGAQYNVFTGDNQGVLQRAAFAGASRTVTQLCPQPVLASSAIHVSGRHTSSPKDWVVFSHYGTVTGGTWTAMREEVVILYLDSTIAVPHVLRLCHTRQLYSSGGSPNATVNRSGTKVLFRSNWGGTANDAYVVDVPSGSSTVIANKAADLNPGDWSAANVVGASTVNYSSKYGRSPFIALDQNQVSGRNILDWPGKAMWDATSGKLWFCGGGINTDGLQTQTMTLTNYDVASDTFIPYQGTTANTTGLWYPKSEAHSFNGVDFDAARRKIYRAIWTSTGAQYGAALGTFNVDAPLDNGNPYVTDAYSTDYGSLVAFPEMGAVLTFRSGTNIRRFNADTLAYVGAIQAPGSVALNGSLAVYHNGAVYFSNGNSGSLAMFKMNSSGTVTAVGAPPVEMSMATAGSPYQPSAVWVKLGSYLYAFHANGNIYRFSFATETWDAGAYSTIPSGVVGTQGTGGYISASSGGGVESAGVVLWIVGTNEQSIKSYLWKP
jgi:hypothetical protein